MTRISAGGLREAGTNTVLALLYAAFAWAHFRAFAIHPRPSLILIVAMETMAAALFFVRRPAVRASHSPWAWITTVGGTFAPFLLRPTAAAADLTWAQVVQTLGASLALLSMASLGRSFGLLPADRGVRQGGPYRLVRHPLYAAYTIQNLGYIASNPSAWNGVVAGAALAFQLHRISNEERLLCGDQEYRAYRARTRWRLLPFVY